MDSPPQPPPPPLTDEDFRTSGFAVSAEIARQIGHQLKTADDISSKVTTIIGSIGVAAGLIAGHVVTTTAAHYVAAGLVVAAAVGTAIAGLWTLSARDDFAYGADPDQIVPLIQTQDSAANAITLAEGLQAARNKNVTALERKHGRLRVTLSGVVSLVLAISLLVAVGGTK